MATAKKKHKVGDVLEVPEGTEVVRPNGEVHTITGGVYVLDAKGSHRVGGDDVEVA